MSVLQTMTSAMLALVLVLSAATASELHAQERDGTVMGQVVDAAGGGRLSGALVTLLEAHREELTREDGSFVFRDVHPGSYTLVVNLIGYAITRQNVEVTDGATVQVEIELPVAALRLSGIVVTGALSEREGRDVLSPISVVAGRELDRKLDGTVAGTLRGEPGLAVASLGPAPARPVIRGLGGDRILMLEDGQRTGDVSSLSPDHAVAIDPLTARQIEVVRGPMSLLYGSSALGGVVNVIRDEIPGERDDHAHGMVIVQGSSVNDGISGGGTLNVPAGPLALRAEASARTSGDVATPLGALENTSSRTLSLAAGGALVDHWGHAGASWRFFSNDYGIPAALPHEHEDEEEEEHDEHDEGVDVEMRRHAFRGQLELHREEGGTVERFATHASLVDYRHSEIEAGGHEGTRFDQTLAALDAVAHLAPRGAFSTGAAGIRVQYRDIRTGGELRTPSTWDLGFAAFAVAEFGTGRTRLQAGARYDVSDYNPRDTAATVTVGGEMRRVRPRTFGSLSGSLGVLFVASDALRLGASISRAYRTPDFNELYSNGPHLAANSYDVGDTDLDEETGIGLDVFARLETGRVSLEVAAFHNSLDNYIFPSSRGRAEAGDDDFRPRFQYTNEDARFIGAEGEVQIAVTQTLILDAALSHVLAEFTSERAPIPVITETDTSFIAASEHPPLIPPMHGRIGLRLERPSWFAGAGMRWAAAQDRLGDFEEPTAGHATGELTAGYRMVRGGRSHAVTLRIDNIFDHEYRDHLSRIKDLMPEAGRDINLSYRLSF